MKTFIKILKITALVVSVACVLFVLYIFVILNLLFLKSEIALRMVWFVEKVPLWPRRVKISFTDLHAR